MKIIETKKSCNTYFYKTFRFLKKKTYGFKVLSLTLNVILPFVVGKTIIGDNTGEVQLLYIAAYFLIPGFENKRDKISTLFFPSILLLGISFIECSFVYFLGYILVQNLVFVFWWISKGKSSNKTIF